MQKRPGPKAGALCHVPKGTEVEMGGIEPPSDVVLSGLLRAQFASGFLGPSHHANMWLARAQPSKSPGSPNGEGCQQWLPK